MLAFWNFSDVFFPFKCRVKENQKEAFWWVFFNRLFLGGWLTYEDSPLKKKYFTVSEFIDQWLGDKVNSGIGLTDRPASPCSMAGRDDNTMPELSLSTQLRSVNLATVHRAKSCSTVTKYRVAAINPEFFFFFILNGTTQLKIIEVKKIWQRNILRINLFNKSAISCKDNLNPDLKLVQTFARVSLARDPIISFIFWIRSLDLLRDFLWPVIQRRPIQNSQKASWGARPPPPTPP